MTTVAQDQFTRVFENVGGALSGLKRYLEAANLVGSTSYFFFIRRDEFAFFPDPATAFAKMKNLLRGIGYGADDDILVIEITEVTAGVSYTADIIRELGATPTVVATSAGTYGTENTVTPVVALGPTGKITITAPTGAPGAAQRVEILVVPSAPRLSMDVTGETEEEGLLKAAALESHQITAANFRTILMEAARARVVDERLFEDLIGTFMGSDTEEMYKENQRQDPTGAIVAAPAGLLQELDQLMEVNTPAQTVQRIVTSLVSNTFSSPSGTQEGTFSVTEKQPTAGTLRLECERGFEGSDEDPEQFSAKFLSTTLDRTIKSINLVRPFRSFDWPTSGHLFTINRKTTENDTFSRIAGLVVKNASLSRMPLEQLKIVVGKWQGGNAQYFRVYEPKNNWLIHSENDFADGAKDITTSSGINLTFTWTNDILANAEVTFYITIHPYRVGDRFDRTISITGGRLQVELRRHFDFAFSQYASSPTISDDVVSPDLPFVKPYLGA